MPVIMTLLILALVATSSTGLGYAAGDDLLTAEQKAIHVLSRTTFGPQNADIERVLSIGIEKYLDQQLNPAGLRDAKVAELLLGFETLSMSPSEIAREYGVASSPGGDMMMTDPRRLTAEQRQQQQRELRRKQRQLLQELTAQRLLRAIYSERQLQEVMTDFWMNHFNVYYPKGFDRILTTDYELNVIRPNALGRFEDLLVAVAKSPAMLFYLDNWLSSAPEDDVRSRIREKAIEAGVRPRRGDREARRRLESILGPTPALFRAKGLNENYARELLELHTVGVEGGYTQGDIVEVARAFTGWTMTAPQAGARFKFQEVMHESGDKTVMGRTFRSGGMDEGLAILKYLAHHPSTARYLAYKLAVRFVADEPPEAIVVEAQRAFERSGGDIAEVLRTLLLSPHFYDPALYQAKTKKPFELVASTARALNAKIRNPRPLAGVMGEMGERLYLRVSPDGYPDEASAWINTNTLLLRLNFALAMASGRLPGVQVELDGADVLFGRLGVPEPTEQQRATTAELLKTHSDGDRLPEDLQQIIATAFKLGSPTFQKR